MNQSQITFNAELIDNEIVIRLTSHNNNQELANKAARKLFVSPEKLDIEETRTNIEYDWKNVMGF